LITRRVYERAAGRDIGLTVADETSGAFSVVWSPQWCDANVARITGGGRPVSKLFRVIEAAARDARRAEALIGDPKSRRAIHVDPEGALLAFEVRAGAIGDDSGERETRILMRDRGVRSARRSAAT
jgi:hypothetical protein